MNIQTIKHLDVDYCVIGTGDGESYTYQVADTGKVIGKVEANMMDSGFDISAFTDNPVHGIDYLCFLKRFSSVEHDSEESAHHFNLTMFLSMHKSLGSFLQISPSEQAECYLPYCTHCGSDDVEIESFGAWDIAKQHWIHHTLDKVTCRVCSRSEIENDKIIRTDPKTKKSLKKEKYEVCFESKNNGGQTSDIVYAFSHDEAHKLVGEDDGIIVLSTRRLDASELTEKESC